VQLGRVCEHLTFVTLQVSQEFLSCGVGAGPAFSAPQLCSLAVLIKDVAFKQGPCKSARMLQQ